MIRRARRICVPERRHEEKFAWQNGYAAFSVSPPREAVRDYSAKQEEDHRTKTFREEWIAMLDRPGIVYDPRFLD